MNETEVENRPVDNDEVLELDPNDFIEEEGRRLYCGRHHRTSCRRKHT